MSLSLPTAATLTVPAIAQPDNTQIMFSTSASAVPNPFRMALDISCPQEIGDTIESPKNWQSQSMSGHPIAVKRNFPLTAMAKIVVRDNR